MNTILTITVALTFCPAILYFLLASCYVVKLVSDLSSKDYPVIIAVLLIPGEMLLIGSLTAVSLPYALLAMLLFAAVPTIQIAVIKSILLLRSKFSKASL